MSHAARNAAQFRALYERSLKDPSSFWGDAAKSIDWFTPPKTVFDESQGVYGRWFPDGVMNTCYNAVDRHAATRPDQVAIIHDSPITGTKRKLTYRELRDEVSALGAVMQDHGVHKGDRVVIYMPMIPEALIAMLACARIGAIHSVVFGGLRHANSQRVWMTHIRN